ncbi:glutathione S-transferase [Aethina tumida]|uniref:glutathione S-transferase n=1 Tax=Aethina tumida TaxID=116153 RepID=UPI002148CB4C|nr:glutathione S-transferase [Aethina tumida]
MAPSYKLTYFDLPALGEPIRWLFTYGGIEFEDNRITHADWPALKPNTPFGQVPVLEHNGKKICQSVAISRYVAKLVGLTGKDDWENLEIDSIVDTFNDFKEKGLIWAFREKDEAKKQALKDEFINTHMPYYLGRFEEQIKKNNGYFVGGHLTWADVFIASLSAIWAKFMALDIYANYPNLKKNKDLVMANKNIQAYLAKHPLA